MKSLKIRSLSSLLIIFITLFCSCTRLGGVIGPYFGNWDLYEIEVDGVPLEGYSEGVMFNFQSELFNIGSVGTLGMFGLWEEHDGLLELRGDKHAGGAERYPTVLGWGNETEITLRILEKNSSTLRLAWDAPDGRVYTYRLRKII